jgi:hypothetical protein
LIWISLGLALAPAAAYAGDGPQAVPCHTPSVVLQELSYAQLEAILGRVDPSPLSQPSTGQSESAATGFALRYGADFPKHYSAYLVVPGTIESRGSVDRGRDRSGSHIRILQTNDFELLRESLGTGRSVIVFARAGLRGASHTRGWTGSAESSPGVALETLWGQGRANRTRFSVFGGSDAVVDGNGNFRLAPVVWSSIDLTLNR